AHIFLRLSYTRWRARPPLFEWSIASVAGRRVGISSDRCQESSDPWSTGPRGSRLTRRRSGRHRSDSNSTNRCTSIFGWRAASKRSAGVASAAPPSRGRGAPVTREGAPAVRKSGAAFGGRGDQAELVGEPAREDQRTDLARLTGSRNQADVQRGDHDV